MSFAQAPLPTIGSNVVVAPYGTPQGKGTLENPLDLPTALGGRSTLIKPGATVWLRGGVYYGAYTSNLRGTQAAPITVRSYPGEQATLDGFGYSVSTLTIKGSWTNYWGLEITNSGTNRSAKRATGVYMSGANTKLINCIIHDTGTGVGFWSNAVGSELYGNIIYNGGWDESDHGHGPAVYAQNQTGVRRILDNVMFNQYSHGVQIYGSSTAYLDNFHLEGNAVFMNGSPSRHGFESNFHIGGGRIAQNPKLINNFAYYTPRMGGRNAVTGYAQGSNNLSLQGNYFAGGIAVQLGTTTRNPTITGNTFYGDVSSVQTKFPNNTFHTTAPSGMKVFVRPNQYEPGRAHIVVYNWAQNDSVDVDLSGVLPLGTAYEVRNAQDFFAAPIVTAVSDGLPVRLPLSNLSVAQPVGRSTAMRSTGSEFNVFVVIPLL